MHLDNRDLSSIEDNLKKWAATTKSDAEILAREIQPRIQDSIDSAFCYHARRTAYRRRNIAAAAALTLLCVGGGAALLLPRQQSGHPVLSEQHPALIMTQEDYNTDNRTGREIPGSLSRPGTLPAPSRQAESPSVPPSTSSNTQQLRAQFAELLAADQLDFAAIQALCTQLNNSTRLQYSVGSTHLHLACSENLIRVTLIQGKHIEKYQLNAESAPLPPHMRQSFRQAADAIK